MRFVFSLYVFGGFIGYTWFVLTYVLVPIFGKYVGPWWQIRLIIILLCLANQLFIALIAFPLSLHEEIKIRKSNGGLIPRIWEPTYKPFLKLLWPWPQIYRPNPL